MVLAHYRLCAIVMICVAIGNGEEHAIFRKCAEKDFLAKHQPLSATSDWNIETVDLEPTPFIIGNQFSFSFAGTYAPINNNQSSISSRDVPMSFIFLRRTGFGKDQERILLKTTLCKLIKENQTDCPEVPKGPFSFSMKPTSIPKHRYTSGVYIGLLLLGDTSAPGATTASTCIKVADIVLQRDGFDYVPAIVAFSIASAASWHLGKASPFLFLPLITGYLMVGVIVGPYVCNLVTNYHVYLIGQSINDLALSFVAFAAGEEIFFPALAGLFKGINMVMLSIAVFTFTFTTFGLMGISSSLAPFMMEESVGCRWAIATLVAIIMVARSPASAVAVAQEAGAKGQIVKIFMGVTVMSDVVVLIGFTLCSALAAALCQSEGGVPFDGISIAILLGQFASIGVIGYVSGLITVGLLRIPFQRLRLRCFEVKRQHLKGFLIISFGYAMFQLLRYIDSAAKKSWGRSFAIEPLMVVMIAGSFAGHRSENRHQFANILQKSAPYIFLPFFTLTGVSLKLDEVYEFFPLAMVIFTIRVVAIAIACGVSGSIYLKTDARYAKWLWMTFLSQAGVALGLAFEVRERFPTWGSSFLTLTLAIVVLNQMFGPPGCKIGLRLVGATDNDHENKRSGAAYGFLPAGDEELLTAENNVQTGPINGDQKQSDPIEFQNASAIMKKQSSSAYADFGSLSSTRNSFI